MKSLIDFASLLILSASPAWAASTPPGSLFVYEGLLTDANGDPLTEASTVTFEVLHDNCVLYKEVQSITPGPAGDFSVALGITGRADSTSNNAERIFAFSGTVSCEGAAPTTIDSFTERTLKVTVNGHHLSPDATIGNIPFSINSQNAQKLDNKSADAFIQANSSKGVTQDNMESLFQRYTKLDAILNGFNSGGTTAGININGNADTATTATNVSGTVAVANGGTGATNAAQARTNLGLGALAILNPSGTTTTYLRGDGVWAVPSGGTGGITSVTATQGVQSSTTAGAVNVSLANIASKTVLANTTASSGLPTAQTASQVLDMIGTTPGSILYRDVTTGWKTLGPGTYGQFLQTTGSGIPQWATPSSSGGMLGGDLSGTTISDATVVAIQGKSVPEPILHTNKILGTNSTGAWEFKDAPSQWPRVNSGDNIYYTTGNVGIGTDSPVRTLHVVGSAKVDGILQLKNYDIWENIQPCSAANYGAIALYKYNLCVCIPPPSAWMQIKDITLYCNSL